MQQDQTNIKHLPQVDNIHSVLSQDVPDFVEIARFCYELHAHADDFPTRQVVHVIGNKSNPDAYSLLVFGYRDMVTIQEFTKIRKLRNVTKVYIDPYYVEEQGPKWPGDVGRTLPPVPVLAIEIGTQNTFLALMTDKTRVPRSSPDDATEITVKAAELDRLYTNPLERNPVPLDKFGDMKKPVNLDDFRIMNDIACVLSHIHHNRPRPQLVERMLYFYDERLRSYVVMAEGLRNFVTFSDMAQIFAIHPTAVNCVGYNFRINTRTDDCFFAPGGIVIHVNDSSHPTKQSIVSVVEQPQTPAAIELPQIPVVNPPTGPAAPVPTIVITEDSAPAPLQQRKRHLRDEDEEQQQPRWKKPSMMQRFVALFSA